MEAVMKSDREIKTDVRDEFDNSFAVPLPPAEAWPVLSDIRRIAPCMPGAELTDVLDEATYQGRISVPRGPIALAFAGVVKVEELDPVNHTARIKAQGADAKGRGGANGTASFRLEPVDCGSKVLVHIYLVLSGPVAQRPRRSSGTCLRRAALFSAVPVKRVSMPVSVGPGPPHSREFPTWRSRAPSTW
jgi:carbon monoxide dehydrogenase subunit G